MTPQQALAAIRALPAVSEPNGMQWLDAADVADILDACAPDAFGCDVCGALPSPGRPAGFKFCARHGADA